VENRLAWFKSMDGLGLKSSIFTQDRRLTRTSVDLLDRNVVTDADTVRDAIYEILERYDCNNFHARLSQYGPC